MKIKLKRIFLGPEYTIGRFIIDTVKYSDSIEDPVRILGPNGEGKIHGKTAIPTGTYQVAMRWSNRFKQMMPCVLNVPFFSGILIHNGVDENSTEGCIILGMNTIKGKVTNSTPLFKRFQALLNAAERNGEKSFITIE